MGIPGNGKKASNGRWWEYYFVRYYVGTVVGGAILVYLNASELSSLRNVIIPGVTDVSKLNGQFLLLLAALGLAYCYFASAPVLVLHATRGVFLTKNTSTFRWLFYGSLALVGLAAVVFYLYNAVPDTVSLLSMTLLAVVLCLQLVPLGFSVRKQGERVHSYYAGLAKARGSGSEDGGQYIESYRHLREHGNAFLIILFELALGAILATASNPYLALIALLLWMMPAALVWLIGTALEYRFFAKAEAEIE